MNASTFRENPSAVLVFLGIFIPGVSYADAGTPLIFGTGILLFLSFVPIILIEAFIFSRGLATSFRKMLIPVISANCASTIIGYPIAWGFLLLLQFVLDGIVRLDAHGSVFDIFLYGLTTPGWIYANGYFAGIALPAAVITNLLTAFLVSVYIEAWIVRKFIKNEMRRVRLLSWKANAATYGCLVLCMLFLIACVFYRGPGNPP